MFLLPGVFWFFGRGLSRDDEGGALSPLARIPLDQLENSGSAAVVVTIPDNEQWTRIRRAWGEPDYLIAAVARPETAGLIHCLDQLGIRIDVTKQGGRIAVKPAKGAPYGYSATCPESGLEFRAAPGVDLTIRATSPRHPMPAGELVLMCYWKNNVKDKMVGIMLDEDLWRISRITAPIGLILILGGAVFQSIRKITGRRNSG